MQRIYKNIIFNLVVAVTQDDHNNRITVILIMKILTTTKIFIRLKVYIIFLINHKAVRGKWSNI